MNEKIKKLTQRAVNKIQEKIDLNEIEVINGYKNPAMESLNFPRPLERRNAINISLIKKEEK